MSALATEQTLRIGAVAALTGVSVETLRYYDREKLLPAANRSLRGARRFPPTVVARVRFVKQAQAAGLTIRDIRELVGLRRGESRAACERMHRILSQRLTDVDARLAELQTFRSTLERHIEACQDALDGQAEPHCPSIDRLERPS